MKLPQALSRQFAAALLMSAATISQAQTPPPNAPPPKESAAPAADQPDFKPEELEQMLASIALYPDPLLSQVLMASTYPIEVVEADRWVKANATLKGDAQAKELEAKPWDPSVKSLVNFPEVLATMSENLSTTVKIGDAFIGQQKQVMETVQKLRAKAKSTGNLESNEQQKVIVQEAAGTQVIVVEPSNPEVIYVPQYSPTVVYGSWPYPAYPPYPYYPPGYVYHPVATFAAGVAIGAAWGYAWGNCNWGGNDVNINVNQNFNRNTNINRDKYQGGRGGQNGSFKHDPSHRQGATYRNQSAADRVGATATNNRATQARNDYRGRAETGRSDISKGAADSFKGNTGAGNRPATGTGNAGAGNRPSTGTGNAGAGAGNRTPQATPRQTPSPSGGNALSGANRGGDAARQASSRGSSSRQSSPSSASRSSGSRSSGGASRGGGGSRGGGRR